MHERVAPIVACLLLWIADMRLKITREDEVRYPPAKSPGSQIRLDFGGHRVVIRVEGHLKRKARKLFLLKVFRVLKSTFRDLRKWELNDSEAKGWINWIRDPEQRPNLKQLPPVQDSDGSTPLGFRLKMERLQSGLTLDELSRRTRVSPKHLSKIEHGHHRPRQSTLWRIKSALKITPQ